LVIQQTGSVLFVADRMTILALPAMLLDLPLVRREKQNGKRKGGKRGRCITEHLISVVEGTLWPGGRWAVVRRERRERPGEREGIDKPHRKERKHYAVQ
jgi:hypothetical protein